MACAKSYDTASLRISCVETGRFTYGGKSLTAYALDDGDLLIEGMAADFSGTDRQNENFTDGAFQRGAKAFLDGPASLCFHHQHAKVLGKVLELEEIPGRGLFMRARVDGAIKGHPELGTIYRQIKNGTLRALSVGGFFKRKLTEAGTKIVDMDFTEISVTPVPMHTGPAFAVVAGKSVTSIEGFDVPTIKHALDLTELRLKVLDMRLRA
jgi:HK97 family phage prohead protease